MKHLLMPGVDLASMKLHPTHRAFLTSWHESVTTNAHDGDVAASTCLQASMMEIAIHGHLVHDWIGVMDAYLLDAEAPLAYSRKFSERLFNFGSQFLQSTVASIHARWWIECAANGSSSVDHQRFANLILAKLDKETGLILDLDFSPTILRHRMKTELTLSLALGAEILSAASALPRQIAELLATSIVDPRKCPPTQYMSTECFRLAALEALGFAHLFPVGIERAIEACTTDLAVGFCDFPMNSKVDAYMGTAKRTARDKPIHSPLTAHHVAALAPRIQDVPARMQIEERLREYVAYLRRNPEDVPAFQMRDVPLRFGDGMTPIEAVCTSSLIR